MISTGISIHRVKKVKTTTGTRGSTSWINIVIFGEDSTEVEITLFPERICGDTDKNALNEIIGGLKWVE